MSIFLICAGTIIHLIGFGPSCCFPREAILKVISEQPKYREQQISAHLHPNGVIEFWTNHITGSFTRFITTPEGQSCIISTGHHTPEIPS